MVGPSSFSKINGPMMPPDQNPQQTVVVDALALYDVLRIMPAPGVTILVVNVTTILVSSETICRRFGRSSPALATARSWQDIFKKFIFLL